MSLYNEDLSAEVSQDHFGIFAHDGDLLACVIAAKQGKAEIKVR